MSYVCVRSVPQPPACAPPAPAWPQLLQLAFACLGADALPSTCGNAWVMAFGSHQPPPAPAPTRPTPCPVLPACTRPTWPAPARPAAVHTRPTSPRSCPPHPTSDLPLSTHGQALAPPPRPPTSPCCAWPPRPPARPMSQPPDGAAGLRCNLHLGLCGQQRRAAQAATWLGQRLQPRRQRQRVCAHAAGGWLCVGGLGEGKVQQARVPSYRLRLYCPPVSR